MRRLPRDHPIRNPVRPDQPRDRYADGVSDVLLSVHQGQGSAEALLQEVILRGGSIPRTSRWAVFLPAAARQARDTEDTIMATGPGHSTSGNYGGCRRLSPEPDRSRHAAPRRCLYLSRRRAPASSGAPGKPSRNGLDLWASMFAPCLLGCPGTPRHHPVSAARRGCGRPDKTAAPGM